jgi:hypothetical protein
MLRRPTSQDGDPIRSVPVDLSRRVAPSDWTLSLATIDKESDVVAAITAYIVCVCRPIELQHPDTLAQITIALHVAPISR